MPRKPSALTMDYTANTAFMNYFDNLIEIEKYIPVKLYKVAGSIHLFQIYGQLTSNQITLERNFLWDVIKIEWEEVFLTLNGAIVQLPISVKIPLRDKYRLGI